MAQQIDDSGYDDFADPNQVQAQINQGTQQALQSPNADTRLTALINANSADNIAKVGQAQAIQTRMQQIIAQANENADPNEDPIARNMRIASAVSTGMVDLSPQMALKANDRLIQLKQAQTQQTALQTQIANENQKIADDKNKANLNSKLDQIVLARQGGKDDDGLPQGLQAVATLDPNDPDYATKLKAAQVDAQQKGYNIVPMLAKDFENNKQSLEAMKGQYRFMQIAAKNQAQGQLTQGGLNELIGNHLFQGAQALARMDSETRKAVLNGEAALGISPLDGVMAQTEIKGVNAAAGAEGRRAGNIAVLNQSVPALGANVISALDDVDRTRFPFLNQGIIAGKNFAGNAKEGVYAAAIQSFVQDYARVVAGATGVTTDAAREDANALIAKADNPEKVKEVVNFLSTKEKDAIGQAGPAALELLANPKSYPHASKIMNTLGFNTLPGIDPNVNGPPPAPAAVSAPTVYGSSSKPEGTTGTYKGKTIVVKNGQWVDK